MHVVRGDDPALQQQSRYGKGPNTCKGQGGWVVVTVVVLFERVGTAVPKLTLPHLPPRNAPSCGVPDIGRGPALCLRCRRVQVQLRQCQL